MGATATADIVSASARRDRGRVSKSAPWEKARKALRTDPVPRASQVSLARFRIFFGTRIPLQKEPE